MTSCTLEHNPTRRGLAHPAPGSSIARRAGIAGACCLLLALLVGLSLSKHLDHDEHQFIASGALLARHGLLPYRDYAYFHMPYLVAIYAGLFRFSDHLLLAARVFSALCAFGTALIVAFTAARVSRELSKRAQAVFVLASVILLIANPLFSRTTGRVWNHDLPTLLLLAAFVLLHPRGRRRKGAAVVAGALMGLAVGVRLTLAPAAAGLAVAELLAGDSTCDRSRWAAVAAYSAGCLVALLPAIGCFVLWPAQFVFGNLTYTTLNTAYRMASGYSHSMTPLSKLGFIVTTSFTSAAGVGLVIGLCWIFYMRRGCWPARRLKAEQWIDLRPIVVVLVAVLIGSLAPTPLFVMYLYTPYAVVVMLMVLAAAPLLRRENGALSAGVVAGMSVAALLCIPQGIGAFRDVSALWDRRRCMPSIVHDAGVELRQQLSGEACVLTTAPIFPLEGRIDIFPEFATGPFALRISQMVTEDDKGRYRIVDEQDLEPLVLSRPRAVVLTTSEEPELDGRIVSALSTRLRESGQTSWGGDVWIVDPGQQADAEQSKR